MEPLLWAELHWPQRSHSNGHARRTQRGRAGSLDGLEPWAARGEKREYVGEKLGFSGGP